MCRLSGVFHYVQCDCGLWFQLITTSHWSADVSNRSQFVWSPDAYSRRGDSHCSITCGLRLDAAKLLSPYLTMTTAAYTVKVWEQHHRLMTPSAVLFLLSVLSAADWQRLVDVLLIGENVPCCVMVQDRQIHILSVGYREGCVSSRCCEPVIRGGGKTLSHISATVAWATHLIATRWQKWCCSSCRWRPPGDGIDLNSIFEIKTSICLQLILKSGQKSTSHERAVKLHWLCKHLPAAAQREVLSHSESAGLLAGLQLCWHLQKAFVRSSSGQAVVSPS